MTTPCLENIRTLHGFWKCRGYGWLLQLSANGYRLHDQVGDKSVEFECGSASEFSRGFDRVRQDHDDHLALHVAREITRYDFDRISALPQWHLPLAADRLADPVLNFRYFRDLFLQDYAFFELRGVDWEDQCRAAESLIDAQTGAAELFKILASLIIPLQDNHVNINDGEQLVISDRTTDLKKLMKAEFDMPSTTLGLPESMACIQPYINRAFLNGSGNTAGNSCITWGMAQPGVGYLNVLRLFGLGDSELGKTASDLPPRRPDHAAMLEEDLEAIDQIMDQALSDLAGAHSLILDVRINAGGYDRVGIAIAERFTDCKRLAFTKQVRRGDGLGPVQNYYMEPAGGLRFAGPVYLLTAMRTASAGEIFTLCMRALPQVHTVGRPTLGILSDNLKKHLPNGWVCSISNEFYRTPKGELFEGSGIPVDVTTPVFDEADFSEVYQIAFSKAVELALENARQSICDHPATA